MYMNLDLNPVFAGLGKLWSQGTMHLGITDFYRYNIETASGQFDCVPVWQNPTVYHHRAVTMYEVTRYT